MNDLAKLIENCNGVALHEGGLGRGFDVAVNFARREDAMAFMDIVAKGSASLLGKGDENG